MFFKSIRLRLIVGFTVIIIMTVSISIFAYVQIASVTKTYRYFVETTVARNQSLLEISGGNSAFRKIARAVIKSDDKEELSSLKNEYEIEKEKLQVQFYRYFEALALDSTLTEQEKSNLKQDVLKLQESLNYDLSIYPVNESNNLEQVDDIFKDTQKELNNLIDLAEQHTEFVNKHTIQKTNFSKKVLIIFSSGTIFLAIVFVLAMIKNIKDVVQSVTKVAKKISLGDLEIDLEHVLDDEGGVILKSLLDIKTVIQTLITDIKEVSEDFKEGKLDSRINLSYYNGEFKSMSQTINENLDSSIDAILYSSELINHLANGNFDIEVLEIQGKKILSDAIIAVQKNMKKVNIELREIIEVAAKGNLNISMNENIYPGEWGKIAEGINLLFASVIEPIREAIDVLNELSAGNLNAFVKGDYQGEFAVMKTTLNNTMNILSNMVEERTEELKLMTEKANHAANVKTDFLASMSHEIRTPMNAIIGMSDLLAIEELNQKQYKYVNNIRISSKALLGIINDILDISKIESGKYNLVEVNYNFPIVIDNIASLMESVALQRNLKFITKYQDDIPKCLYGDDIRLRQVLINIIGNAIKFTNEGHVKFGILIKDKTIVFEISDTGIGIKEEDVSRLFDVFEQMELEKNRNKGGSGLGLAITKKIVDLMNGTIEVFSTYGVGTTFFVEIPLMRGDESKMLDLNESQEFIKAPLAKVLIVDDMEMNLHVAKALLELCDIKCDTATSGIDAIQKVKQNEYDLVFMDHMMPQMDGVETTKIIRAMGFLYDDFPIIALTANAVQGAKEMLFEAGMNDFLSKPIDRKELDNILKKWIPKQKQQKAIQENKSEIILSETLIKVQKIEGIDVLLGLQSVNQMQDVYEHSLKLLNKKIPELITSLNKKLDKNLKDFSIDVHGIKGSLAICGILELSNQAYDLEMASKNNDIDFCTKSLPSFIKQLNFFNEQLGDALKKDIKIKKLKGEPAQFLKLLDDVLLSCEQYDDEKAKQLISDDYTFGVEEDEIIEQIKKELDNYDFDNVIDIIKKYNKKI